MINLCRPHWGLTLYTSSELFYSSEIQKILNSEINLALRVKIRNCKSVVGFSIIFFLNSLIIAAMLDSIRSMGKNCETFTCVVLIIRCCYSSNLLSQQEETERK